MAEIPPVARARVATLDDVPKIQEFYRDHRTHAVYERHVSDIKLAVENQMFLVVENLKGEMIAGAGVYILNGGQRTDCLTIGGRPQVGVAAELGSVLMWKDGLDKDERVSGVWLPFLWSTATMLFYMHVSGMSGPQANGYPRAANSNLPVDYLVCNVQLSEESVSQRIQGQDEHGNEIKAKDCVKWAPLKWVYRVVLGGLDNAFHSTTDDKNAQLPKNFYSTHVGNLVSLAKYLQNCIRNDALLNRAGDKLGIDLKGLINHFTISPADAPQRLTILDNLVANERAVAELASSGIGWGEFGRIHRNKFTRQPEPLAKINSGYHPIAANTQDPLSRGASTSFSAASHSLVGDNGGAEDRLRAHHHEFPGGIRPLFARGQSNLQGPILRRTAALL